MESQAAFVCCGAIVLGVLYWVNGVAERRLVPRFEKEFRGLSKRQRIAATIAITLLLALTTAGVLLSAAAAHKKLVSARGHVALYLVR